MVEETMMTGEFEKRFQENSGEQTERGVPIAWWNPNGEKVMKWIEEAKKEFPKYDESHARFKGLESNVYLWFIKWFGDE